MALDQQQDEPTIGKLVVDAQRDFSFIMKKEIELAKSELKVSVKAGGMGAVFFAVAGFLGLMAIIIFSVAAAYLIHWNGEGLDLHWAFLCVTGFYLLLAGILAFLGLRSVKKVKGPERAMAQVKQNSQAFKRGA